MDTLGLLFNCCMKLHDYLWNVNIYDLAISYLRKCFINLFIVTLKMVFFMCVSYVVCGCFQTQKRALDSLDLGRITSSCKSPSVDVLFESNKHSITEPHYPYLCTFAHSHWFPSSPTCHMYLNLDFCMIENMKYFVFSNFHYPLLLPFALRSPLVVPPFYKVRILVQNILMQKQNF